MTEDQAKNSLAAMLGYVHGLHDITKDLDRHGLPEADQIACALEDLSTMLEEALTGVSGPEALASAL